MEVSKNPASHPFVAELLKNVKAFDIVDDEGQVEMNVNVIEPPSPAQWDSDENPPYAYYSYFIYANLVVLNSFRKSVGLNTFAYRPHCGAAGELDHLAVGFMLADNIVHGINLRRSSALQYLYFLTQIGITCSVVGENSLYIQYEKNPFPQLFRRGLNVTLSTDNPLSLHYTNEPLSEEYAIAAQLWKLAECDLCEIAMNSMRQSGNYASEQSLFSNDTGVPDIRLRMREEFLKEEWQIINAEQKH